ncbi:hypothetical protein OE88DRAFT_1739582 [Heliocybe sulcata]|uniref:Uncharacterized protein n=1 Tax=Heliocybe sulcata TaxID=5364 RepID=A0A5C3MPI5_9AGAM|nr:hypothetical protein OE88DRAFT_1739582 [Heliocybe sulcata]
MAQGMSTLVIERKPTAVLTPAPTIHLVTAPPSPPDSVQALLFRPTTDRLELITLRPYHTISHIFLNHAHYFGGHVLRAIPITRTHQGFTLIHPLVVWMDETALQAEEEVEPVNQPILRLTNGALEIYGAVIIGCWQESPSTMFRNIDPFTDLTIALTFLVAHDSEDIPMPLSIGF